MLCEYSCGKEATHQFKNGKWCCEKVINKCLEWKRKNKNSHIGLKHSENSKNKIRSANEGKPKTEEHCRNISNTRKEKKLSEGRSNPMFGRHHSEETIEKIRKSLLEKVQSEEHREKNSGENNYGWKGGGIGYLHDKARKLFGKDKCEKCGIFIEDYIKDRTVKRFDIHCVTKDYTIMEKFNWLCLCRSCHWIVEKSRKS